VPSQKTVVIDHLWDVLRSQDRSVATFADVKSAIEHCNEHEGIDLSADNVANFMKDFLRGGNSSKNWPDRLTQLRMCAEQVTGEDRIFQFVPFKEGQHQPFPNPFEPAGEEDEFVIESLSLPLATKSLGRLDESWLIQVSVWLRLLENHFARSTDHRFVEISHLQNGIKLSRSEIDALFLAVEENGSGERENVLITCEAKQQKDPILGDQIVRQVTSAFKSIENLDLKIEKVVPTAVKAIKNRGAIYVAEFEAWSKDEASREEKDLKELMLQRASVYRLVPPVPGVGYTKRRSKKITKPSL
jgi:hypothetical protein